MAPPRIDEFVFDEGNEAKLDRHGLAPEQLAEVLLNEAFVVVPNRRGRRATHLVIGRDADGRCLAIPIEPTGHPGWWRPVTAWPCKRSEQIMLQRRAR